MFFKEWPRRSGDILSDFIWSPEKDYFRPPPDFSNRQWPLNISWLITNCLIWNDVFPCVPYQWVPGCLETNASLWKLNISFNISEYELLLRLLEEHGLKNMHDHMKMIFFNMVITGFIKMGVIKHHDFSENAFNSVHDYCPWNIV